MSSSPIPTPARNRGWKGSTKNTQESTAMLGGKFWEKGDKVSCLFARDFVTKFGPAYEFLLTKPLTVNVDEFGVTTKNGAGMTRLITRFAMPPLAGFDMAYQDLMAAGFDGFKLHDRIIIECVDINLLP